VINFKPPFRTEIMKRDFIQAFLIILFFAGVLLSCKRNHYKANISSVKLDIEIKRLEKDLFAISPDEIAQSVPSIKDKYKGFLQLFSYVINTGEIDDPSFSDLLAEFCTNKQNNDVYALTMKIFPDIEEIEGGIEKAFRHYRYYFPGRNVPSVFTCITGFNSSIITGDYVLGVGLDRYLGADCEYYPRLNIFKYLAAKMTPDYIIPDCMYGWGASEWDFTEMNYSSGNVIANMIHEGKLRYFVKCMLPETPDEIIFGFTDDQMNFCRNNEAQMWLYLVENDLLFRTDYLTIRKLTGDAPFTSYFTNESPGRAAVWIGFRIVESYMMKNPGINLKDMLDNVDILEIMEKSRYNPK
jgi:hypothetical protein